MEKIIKIGVVFFFFLFPEKIHFFYTGQHHLYANTSPTNKYPNPWQVRPRVLMLYHKTVMGSLKMAIIIIVVVVVVIIIFFFFSCTSHSAMATKNEYSKTKAWREMRAWLWYNVTLTGFLLSKHLWFGHSRRTFFSIYPISLRKANYWTDMVFIRYASLPLRREWRSRLVVSQYCHALHLTTLKFPWHYCDNNWQSKTNDPSAGGGGALVFVCPSTVEVRQIYLRVLSRVFVC